MPHGRDYKLIYFRKSTYISGRMKLEHAIYYLILSVTSFTYDIVHSSQKVLGATIFYFSHLNPYFATGQSLFIVLVKTDVYILIIDF